MVQNDTTMEDRVGWRKEHSSAWIPARKQVHPSEGGDLREEPPGRSGCWGLLTGTSCWTSRPGQSEDMFDWGDTLDRYENRVLDLMLEDLGIVFHTAPCAPGEHNAFQSVGEGLELELEWV